VEELLFMEVVLLVEL